LVLHGPNLNRLGTREPAVYGRMSLTELDEGLVELGRELGLDVRCSQSNHEGELIDQLHRAATPMQSDTHADGIILNPGGYTHTSVALHDALRAIDLPCVEVHFSNLYGRESFRHISMTGAACVGVIMGLGPDSYALALRHLAQALAG